MSEDNKQPKFEVVAGDGEQDFSDAAAADRARRLVLHVARERSELTPEQELAITLAKIEDSGHLNDIDVFLLHQAMVVAHEVSHTIPNDLSGYTQGLLDRKPSGWTNEAWAVVLDKALDKLTMAYDFMDEAPLTAARQSKLVVNLGEAPGYQSKAWQDEQLVKSIMDGLKLSYEIARSHAAPGQNPYEYIAAVQKELILKGVGPEPPMPETEAEMHAMHNERAKLTMDSMSLLNRTLRSAK